MSTVTKGSGSDEIFVIKVLSVFIDEAIGDLKIQKKFSHYTEECCQWLESLIHGHFIDTNNEEENDSSNSPRQNLTQMNLL